MEYLLAWGSESALGTCLYQSICYIWYLNNPKARFKQISWIYIIVAIHENITPDHQLDTTSDWKCGLKSAPIHLLSFMNKTNTLKSLYFPPLVWNEPRDIRPCRQLVIQCWMNGPGLRQLVNYHSCARVMSSWCVVLSHWLCNILTPTTHWY